MKWAVDGVLKFDFANSTTSEAGGETAGLGSSASSVASGVLYDRETCSSRHEEWEETQVFSANFALHTSAH